MRLVRRGDRALQFLPQPPLPQVPVDDEGKMAGKAQKRSFACQIFPQRLHCTARGQPGVFVQQEDDDKHPFPLRFGDASRVRRQPGQRPWRKNRSHDVFALVDPEDARTLPCSLHCSRRRSFRRRFEMDPVRKRLAVPGEGPFKGLQRQVHALLRAGVRKMASFPFTATPPNSRPARASTASNAPSGRKHGWSMWSLRWKIRTT